MQIFQNVKKLIEEPPRITPQGIHRTLQIYSRPDAYGTLIRAVKYVQCYLGQKVYSRDLNKESKDAFYHVHQEYQNNPDVTITKIKQNLNISYDMASSCLTALKWLNDSKELEDVTEEL